VKFSNCLAKLGMFLLMLAFLFPGCSGCDRSQSGEEAKSRVKEKKDITEEVKTRKVALQEIDLSRLPDISELEKLILMTQEEIAARLGQYKFSARVSYATDRSGKGIEMFEEQNLQQASNGDFQIEINNNKGRAFDLIWKGGQVFDRSGNASWRKSRSTGKHLYWREKIYSSFDSFYKYFRGHLKFNAPVAVDYEGRDALKIEFSLDPQGKTPEADLPLKVSLPNQYQVSMTAAEKILNKNRKRVSRYGSAAGYLIIDKKAAVILSFDFSGEYAIAIADSKKQQLKEKGVDPGNEVVFVMKANHFVKDIGGPVDIGIPEAAVEMDRVKPAPKADDILNQIGSELLQKTKDMAPQKSPASEDNAMPSEEQAVQAPGGGDADSAAVKPAEEKTETKE